MPAKEALCHLTHQSIVHVLPDNNLTPIRKSMKKELPVIGFLRLPQVLEIIPVSKSTWWQGCKDGRFPKPVKLGPKTTAWRVEDIAILIERIGSSNRTRD